MIDRMKWILTNLRFFRNLDNKNIVFAYWQYVDGWNRKTYMTDEQFKKLAEPESITRARRKWVEKDPEKYGRFDPTAEEQRIIKQFSLTEYFVMNK